MTRRARTELLVPAPPLISPHWGALGGPLPPWGLISSSAEQGGSDDLFPVGDFLRDSQKWALLGLMDTFMMWLVVRVSWVHTHVKTYRVAYFKYMQLIVGQGYLNTAI